MRSRGSSDSVRRQHTGRQQRPGRTGSQASPVSKTKMVNINHFAGPLALVSYGRSHFVETCTCKRESRLVLIGHRAAESCFRHASAVMLQPCARISRDSEVPVAESLVASRGRATPSPLALSCEVRSCDVCSREVRPSRFTLALSPSFRHERRFFERLHAVSLRRRRPACRPCCFRCRQPGVACRKRSAGPQRGACIQKRST